MVISEFHVIRGAALPWPVWVVCNLDQTHIWELPRIGISTKTTAPHFRQP